MVTRLPPVSVAALMLAVELLTACPLTMVPLAIAPSEPELIAVVTPVVPSVPSSNLYQTNGRSAVVAPLVRRSMR